MCYGSHSWLVGLNPKLDVGCCVAWSTLLESQFHFYLYQCLLGWGLMWIKPQCLSFFFSQRYMYGFISYRFMWFHSSVLVLTRCIFRIWNWHSVLPKLQQIPNRLNKGIDRLIWSVVCQVYVTGQNLIQVNFFNLGWFSVRTSYKTEHHPVEFCILQGSKRNPILLVNA